MILASAGLIMGFELKLDKSVSFDTIDFGHTDELYASSRFVVGFQGFPEDALQALKLSDGAQSLIMGHKNILFNASHFDTTLAIVSLFIQGQFLSDFGMMPSEIPLFGCMEGPCASHNSQIHTGEAVLPSYVLLSSLANASLLVMHLAEGRNLSPTTHVLSSRGS